MSCLTLWDLTAITPWPNVKFVPGGGMEDCMPRASCRPPPCKGEINTADESWTDTDGWIERWMDRDS